MKVVKSSASADLMLCGRLFQSQGASTAKIQSCFVFNLDSGIVRNPRLADLRGLFAQEGAQLYTLALDHLVCV